VRVHFTRARAYSRASAVAVLLAPMIARDGPPPTGTTTWPKGLLRTVAMTLEVLLPAVCTRTSGERRGGRLKASLIRDRRKGCVMQVGEHVEGNSGGPTEPQTQ
jgi:hypothetical protein